MSPPTVGEFTLGAMTFNVLFSYCLQDRRTRRSDAYLDAITMRDKPGVHFLELVPEAECSIEAVRKQLTQYAEMGHFSMLPIHLLVEK